MIAPELREKVLNHLSNPLKPLSPQALGSAAGWVTQPTYNPTDKGGLSPTGLAVFKQDKEVLAAHKTHKEQTRIQIHAVIGTCSAFIAASKKNTPIDKKAKARETLAKGIAFLNENKEVDHIQTTRKGGTLLTDRFKGMMSKAATPLNKHCPPLAQLLITAASFQRKHEEKEAQKREGIAEMA